MIGLSYVRTVKIKQYFGFGMGGENKEKYSRGKSRHKGPVVTGMKSLRYCKMSNIFGTKRVGQTMTLKNQRRNQGLMKMLLQVTETSPASLKRRYILAARIFRSKGGQFKCPIIKRNTGKGNFRTKYLAFHHKLLNIHSARG